MRAVRSPDLSVLAKKVKRRHQEMTESPLIPSGNGHDGCSRARSRAAEPSSTGPVVQQGNGATRGYGKRSAAQLRSLSILIPLALPMSESKCARSPVLSANPLLEAIELVEQTAAEAQRTIAEGVASIDRARQQLVTGALVSEIVDDLVARGGREARLRSSAAIDAFEHAVMVYRIGLIRAMVDDEELSFTEVGRHLGVSRQMITRLYRSDEWPPKP